MFFASKFNLSAKSSNPTFQLAMVQYRHIFFAWSNFLRLGPIVPGIIVLCSLSEFPNSILDILIPQDIETRPLPRDPWMIYVLCLLNPSLFIFRHQGSTLSFRLLLWDAPNHNLLACPEVSRQLRWLPNNTRKDLLYLCSLYWVSFRVCLPGVRMKSGWALSCCRPYAAQPGVRSRFCRLWVVILVQPHHSMLMLILAEPGYGVLQISGTRYVGFEAS